jgi:hypothetical protein
VLGSTRVSFKLFAPVAALAIALLGLLPAGASAATLSKALRQRLAKLPRRRHLTLVIEAQAPGAVPASRELPLPGRKKASKKLRKQAVSR